LKDALENLHDSIDVVYIGTTPRSHRSLVEESLKFNKHVLLEKPLAATMDDADAIVAASDAAAASCVLAMNIGMRYNEALRELRQRVIVNKELGTNVRAVLRMHYSQWPREWQTQPWCAGREEGGPLREVGTHFFSALLEISGAHDDACQASPVKARVRATLEYPDQGSTAEEFAACETKATGVIELEGGALPSEGIIVEFSVLTDAPGDLYELTIVPTPELSSGEHKSLTLFNFVSLRDQEGEVLVRNSPYGRKECVRTLVARAKKINTEGIAGDPTLSIVTARHGRNAQRILDAVLHSKGEYVAVEFDQ
jgi:predicted dehydrogenase